MSACSVIPGPAVDRIIAIAARTASDADGEALSAARLLNRELGRAGLRIEDVLRRGFAPTPDCVPPASRSPGDHHDLAADALTTASIFNVTELAFLRRMADAHRATPAQIDWLAALASRSRRFRSATSGARPC